MSKIYDALVLGRGPASLSVALGLGRVHRTCIVFSSSTFRNDGIHASHSLLSRDHVSPEVIRDAGREQIERYENTEYCATTIVKVEKEKPTGGLFDEFVAQNAQGEQWRGRTVVFATGVKDVFPDIDGYAANWPFNIYQCLFCDGHERSSLPKGILAFPFGTAYFQLASLAHYQSMPPGASHVPSDSPWSLVTVFTNGAELDRSDLSISSVLETASALGIKVEERRIKKLVSASPTEKQEDGEGVNVILEDDTSIYMGFLVHKPATTLRAEDLIDHLGVETVQVDNPVGAAKIIKRMELFGATNVKGVFVAGDAGTLMTQVSAAIFHGVGAAGGVAHELLAQDDQIAVARFREKQACGDGTV